MSHHVTFHLGLHCLPEYLLIGAMGVRIVAPFISSHGQTQ